MAILYHSFGIFSRFSGDRLRKYFALLILCAICTALFIVPNALAPALLQPSWSDVRIANSRIINGASISSASQSDKQQPHDLFTLFATKVLKNDNESPDSSRFLVLPSSRRLIAQRNALFVRLTKNCSLPAVSLFSLAKNSLSARNSLNTCTDKWQEVKKASSFMFVYSAYIDLRSSDGPEVRTIATTRTKTRPIFYCILWYDKCENNACDQQLLVQGTASPIRENWGLIFSAFYLHCPVPNKQKRLPIALSIAVSAYDKQSTHWPESLHPLSNLMVINNHLQVQAWNSNVFNNSQILRGELAVCVKPIHYDYDQWWRILEFISLNRLLGVSHFMLYVNSVSDRVRCLLQQLQSDHVVTLLDWTGLPLRSQVDIRTQNLFAALNDCSMRAMGRFRYVAMIDLDEIIFPYLHKKLTDLLDRMRSFGQTRPVAGAYSFQNAFFYLGWPDESFGWHSISLSKTRRRSELLPHRQRSKLIVRPDGVLEVGNHFVWQYMSGFGAVHVQPKAGLLHHYRYCEFGGTQCLQTPFVLDRRAHAWADELTMAMKQLNAQVAYCHNKTLLKTIF